MKLIKSLMKQAAIAAILLVFAAGSAQARIEGIAATAFSLTARQGHISTAEGNSIYAWGYANGTGLMQYPGVTMIVNQGDTVTVTLRNALPVRAGNVSIVFPGQKVTASGGVTGLLTQEAPPDGVTTVTYTFTATDPGTYLYHSGTNPDLQVEMGLVGALIVRPAGFGHMMPTAYGHMDSAYTHGLEYLFLLTEMDARIHDLVETRGPAALAATDYLSNYFPSYWFINGRTAPDTMFRAFAPWLPTQPYNSMPMMHPGDKLLMRVIGAGRHLHPFHYHGNHARIIAIDGKLLSSAPGQGADLSNEQFTIQSVPGRTYDAIFEWTGKGLGWDIYGHTSVSDPIAPNEYEPDHGKPFPVILPDQQDLTFGGMYSGSPFLGTLGTLPPGEGGLNPHAGFAYMWHSHTEKEMTNFDIFPGGMMTMLVIVPHDVVIEH
ncbi:MAG: multicopper oxidase domain-containing protein [Candidatus Omnitrophota bacterium]